MRWAREKASRGLGRDRGGRRLGDEGGSQTEEVVVKGEPIDGVEEAVKWLCSAGSWFAVTSSDRVTWFTLSLPDGRVLPEFAEETEVSSDERTEWTLAGEGGGEASGFRTLSTGTPPDSKEPEDTLDSSVCTLFMGIFGGELSKSLSERFPDTFLCASASTSAWASSSRLYFAVLFINCIEIAY